MTPTTKNLDYTDSFADRHIGPRTQESEEMLKFLGFTNMDALIDATVPRQIRLKKPLAIGPGKSEVEVLGEIQNYAEQNQIFRSYIGMGFYDTVMPVVLLRNILENPGWYTQYTPYQAEIAQGRLEALLNFQTMIRDLTGLEIANASMLDEATAAAEAMTMCFNIKGRDLNRAFFVSETCHPQNIAVMRTRAEALGIKLIVGNHEQLGSEQPLFGAILQYPATDGLLHDYEKFIKQVHGTDALVVLVSDILSLTVLKSPGELGVDIAVGSTQRFGCPMSFGGPHAAFFATKDAYKRQIPGRLVGLSKDIDGKRAIRLALQTREQHIRREKASSNICTAGVLLAILSSMYAIYHGPHGIRKIAERVHLMTALFANGLKRLGYDIGTAPFFDTLRITTTKERIADILKTAKTLRINLRQIDALTLGVSLDEATSAKDIADLFSVFSCGRALNFGIDELLAGTKAEMDPRFVRTSSYLTQPVFNSYHSETEMLRYLAKLQSRDLSLTTSMTPLGSCTMKLNATAEMIPLTWSGFTKLHPFVPAEQAKGYHALIQRLESMLTEVTGFKAASVQPNSGAQGEYTGLLVIQKYHQSRKEGHRKVCLIPHSAHGTNPASASMAGMSVIEVACDAKGNIDVADLRAKAEEHRNNLSCLMVTYPSTHGVFEEAIAELCEIVHKNGGQVYMDGANMNAQVGLCRPAEIGADVCHLNLHKTFALPHGGGGPGVGPIAVAAHLAPFLPTHPLASTGGATGIGPVVAAPWGSANLLPIAFSYIAMMGSEGLTRATQTAILNANYVAKRLDPYYPVLYKGKEGRVAHECIVDMRQLKATTGIEVEDIAKRLMDYGYHAPTMSFPVPGTMMIEPTESESKQELDRFCDAMIAIREEIAEIEKGQSDRQNNVLKKAPHTAEQLTRAEWDRPYSREKAGYPLPYLREHKVWPTVSRVDNVYGDRNLCCTL